MLESLFLLNINLIYFWIRLALSHINFTHTTLQWLLYNQRGKMSPAVNSYCYLKEFHLNCSQRRVSLSHASDANFEACLSYQICEEEHLCTVNKIATTHTGFSYKWKCVHEQAEPTLSTFNYIKVFCKESILTPMLLYLYCLLSYLFVLSVTNELSVMTPSCNVGMYNTSKAKQVVWHFNCLLFLLLSELLLSRQCVCRVNAISNTKYESLSWEWHGL